MHSITFAVAEQGDGEVTFSALFETHEQPEDEWVTMRHHDVNSGEVDGEWTDILADWTQANGSWIGYAGFEVESGETYFAFVHKDNSHVIQAATTYYAT